MAYIRVLPLGFSSALMIWLTAESSKKSSSTGWETQLWFWAIFLLPFAVSLLSTTWGPAAPRYLRDSLLPAIVLYICILLGSLLQGATALNWLVFALLYLLPSAALGHGVGRLLRSH